MESKLRVSQSLIKDWWEYRTGNECGVILEFRHIKKDWGEPSEVMQLGNRFEYDATGALDYHGNVPEIPRTSRGYPIAKYNYLAEQVPLFKAMVKHYKVTDIKVNQVLDYDNGDYIVEVHPDIECKIDGTPAIIDIKTTGLLNVDYDSQWSWRLEGLELRPKLMVQAIHTKVVCQEACHIENIPFYFWVFSSGNDGDARIIKANVSPRRIVAHLDEIESVAKEFMEESVLGFTPRPAVGKCKACPYAGRCQHEMIIPDIDVVEIE